MQNKKKSIKKAFIQANDKLLIAKNALNEQPQLSENEENDGKLSEAQAPGKPTENDGFIPPKNWDGKKVRNPHGSDYGWSDKNKHVLIPSGPKGHGGPHWDVQNPKKPNDHRNVFPGGKER